MKSSAAIVVVLENESLSIPAATRLVDFSFAIFAPFLLSMEEYVRINVAAIFGQ